MKKYKITEQDYIKAQRKASREEEIALHGKPIRQRRMVHLSKKVYNRMQMKAGLKILSFFVDLCKLLQFFLGKNQYVTVTNSISNIYK